LRQIPAADADLAAVVDAWATLPPAVRAAFVALVKAAGGMPPGFSLDKTR